MKVGIVSNTDSFIPFSYALLSQAVSVHVFFSPPDNAIICQKVKAYILQSQLPFTEEKKIEKDLYQWLQNGNYEVCFVLGYKRLIRIDRLKNCPTAVFNIHFGLLPSFKGPVPVFWQLKMGMPHIGLSIHLLTQKFDDGPVVWLKEIPNQPHYNYQLVNDLFSQLCVEGVFYVLRFLINRFPVPFIDRSSVKPGYYKRPGLEQILIHWLQMSADEICNLIRACNPWNKGALTFFNQQEIKILDAEKITFTTSDNIHAIVPGTILQHRQELQVVCINGEVLNITMLNINGAFLPARYAGEMGFIPGKVFTSSVPELQPFTNTRKLQC